MNTLLFRVSAYVRDLIEDEQGQDLVEYALIVALIAFAATTGMRVLSTGMNHAFTQIAAVLSTNIS
jgi:pilus assembly protein Flp/PilA